MTGVVAPFTFHRRAGIVPAVNADRQKPPGEFDSLPEAARPLVGATGKRVRLAFPDPLNLSGLPILWRVTVMGDPFAHGWRLPGGGWGLYRLGESDRPSWRLPVRLRRKRRIARISVDDLISVTEGWGA